MVHYTVFSSLGLLVVVNWVPATFSARQTNNGMLSESHAVTMEGRYTVRISDSYNILKCPNSLKNANGRSEQCIMLESVDPMGGDDYCTAIVMLTLYHTIGYALQVCKKIDEIDKEQTF